MAQVSFALFLLLINFSLSVDEFNKSFLSSRWIPTPVPSLHQPQPLTTHFINNKFLQNMDQATFTFLYPQLEVQFE